MIDLALSILFSSLIFVVFKLYVRYGVQTYYAIIVNYLVACLVGLLVMQEIPDLSTIPGKPWFAGTVGLGMLFIVVFNLMARTSQKSGVSVASVATKMSLVIPVAFGVVLYGEALGPVKLAGIALALAAVYFTSVKQKGLHISRRELLLPVLVFLGSGIIDTSIKFLEETRLDKDEFPLFSASIFAAAAITGLLLVLINSFRVRIQLRPRNVLGGIALGIPNFFSIYYLLRALQHPSLDSASVFTINNVAIVMFSTLLGIALFREQISPKNWGGIALAVVSIIMVAFT